MTQCDFHSNNLDHSHKPALFVSDFKMDDDVLLVIILAPTSVVVFLLVILTAVYCVM